MSDSRDPVDETTVLVTAVDVTLEPIGARALLVDRDVLLVPDPPPLLVEPRGELVAVIAPVPAGSGPVERIAVTGVELLGADEPVPGVTASVVRLAGPSRYVVQAEPFTQRRLTQALLAAGGDLWAAMRGLGYDSPMTAGPGEASLTAVHEDLLDAFAAGPCRVIRTCFPHPPRPGDSHPPHSDQPPSNKPQPGRPRTRPDGQHPPTGP
ncbi:hypothetical protein [Streptomyces sp. NPDC057302]|uniref:hypothetical protein n=1 Tax=Streptomyces sp. NPDC057302 TaxID=3346094 RepID=UPI003627B0B4